MMFMVVVSFYGVVSSSFFEHRNPRLRLLRPLLRVSQLSLLSFPKTLAKPKAAPFPMGAKAFITFPP